MNTWHEIMHGDLLTSLLKGLCINWMVKVGESGP